jgi:ubiquinone/menaquinone biosynthesis C-methylase UbiE
MIELLWNNPISEGKMNGYIKTLEFAAGQTVIDVGCGTGEVLIRLAERYQIRGRGIDISRPHLDVARERSFQRNCTSAVEFVDADARSFSVEPDSIDLTVCLGSSHAFGLGSDAYRRALESMRTWLAPRGLILIGEGYMKQPASPEYRQLLGESLPDEMTHATNVAVGQNLGLIALAAWTSTLDEWDEFEWSYQRIVERKASVNTYDQALLDRLVRRREWMDAYLRWGRDTLGFGVYLFQKPA